MEDLQIIELYNARIETAISETDTKYGRMLRSIAFNSWEGYKALLENGCCKSNAFMPYPVLSQQVTVYSFTDFEAPEEYDAATQAISFTIDPDKTTILQYGFNGGEIGDDGFRRYSYFVPNETSRRVWIALRR